MLRNCLTYAVAQWRKHGGYLMVRRSRLAEKLRARGRPIMAWVFSWVPHFLHQTRDGKVTHYTPDPKEADGSKGFFAQWLHLWHFKGHVHQGDDHYTEQDEQDRRER